MMRMYLAAVLAALLLAPGVSARFLTGAGPAYWAEPARNPMHYPAAQAAVEGFVANPMGGHSYCNARLVKPVCVDGMWVQNRCIAQLQGLKTVTDNHCLETKEVFAVAPTTGLAVTAEAVTQPIPVTEADMKKFATKGYIFRGVAAVDMPGAWRVNESSGALESRRTKAVIDTNTRFWWSAPPAAGATDTPK